MKQPVIQKIASWALLMCTNLSGVCRIGIATACLHSNVHHATMPAWQICPFHSEISDPTWHICMLHMVLRCVASPIMRTTMIGQFLWQLHVNLILQPYFLWQLPLTLFSIVLVAVISTAWRSLQHVECCSTFNCLCSGPAVDSQQRTET